MSIIINNLSKWYGRNPIYLSLSYTFKDNTHYLIKGQNGIGKSTLIKCILRQVRYSGEIKVDGRISYSPEEVVLPSTMTSYDFIKLFSTLTDEVIDFDDKLNELLDLFNVKEIKNRPIGTLSKGQKQKINIIEALLTPSEILILDEPLSGLDQESKKNLLRLLKLDKRIVIVISHEVLGFRHKDYQFLKIERGMINEYSKDN